MLSHLSIILAPATEEDSKRGKVWHFTMNEKKTRIPLKYCIQIFLYTMFIFIFYIFKYWRGGFTNDSSFVRTNSKSFLKFLKSIAYILVINVTGNVFIWYLRNDPCQEYSNSANCYSLVFQHHLQHQLLFISLKFALRGCIFLSSDVVCLSLERISPMF